LRRRGGPLITGQLVREAFNRGVLLGATLVLTASVVLGLAMLIVPGMVPGSEVAVALLGLFLFGFVVTPLADRRASRDALPAVGRARC